MCFNYVILFNNYQKSPQRILQVKKQKFTEVK